MANSFIFDNYAGVSANMPSREFHALNVVSERSESLVSGTETICVEGSHRNGNICHQTSYTMMMTTMTIISNGSVLWPRQKVWINS